MYGEARSNIDILYQTAYIYCTINLLHCTINLSDNTILMMLLTVWTMRQTEIHIYE